MYLMLTWLKCSFGTQTTGGGGIFFAIFLLFITAHDTNQNDELSTLWIPGSRQQYIMKFWSPCWMYESLLSSLPLWSNYTKSEKQSAVKGCCEYPPPQSRCWGWQPQEVTSLHLGYLLILQPVISLPTLPLLVALLLILEKSFYIAQVGGWYLFYGTSLSKFWEKLVIFYAVHFIDIACE